jgi:hypothetical protein
MSAYRPRAEFVLAGDLSNDRVRGVPLNRFLEQARSGRSVSVRPVNSTLIRRLRSCAAAACAIDDACARRRAGVVDGRRAAHVSDTLHRHPNHSTATPDFATPPRRASGLRWASIS